MLIIKRSIVLSAALALIAGCSSTGYKSSEREKRAMDDVMASTQGIGETRQFTADDEMAWQDKALMAKRTFYFSYDKYSLNDEDKLALDAHVKFLTNNPDMVARVEGHTDERGSREYNISLGERRAKTIFNYLRASGASDDQLVLVSYGKEKPADPRHLEEAWERNRRAVIIYEAS